MFEQYISSSSFYEIPSFAVAVYSILLALVLSTTLALTYRYTFQGDSFPNNFFQAIVLSSTVSTMVMMAVGDNLAVGFGVLGAVSIIRFRTLIRNTRNIIFIFASLSVGIATGVLGYAIAISGTLMFCLTVILLYFSPYGREGTQKFEIIFTVSDGHSLLEFENLMASYNIKPIINRIRHLETDLTRYTYLLGLKTSIERNEFFQKIKNLDGFGNVRFEFKDSDVQL